MLDLPGEVVLYAGGVRRLPVLDEDQHTEEHVDELLLGHRRCDGSVRPTPSVGGSSAHLYAEPVAGSVPHLRLRGLNAISTRRQPYDTPGCEHTANSGNQS